MGTHVSRALLSIKEETHRKHFCWPELNSNVFYPLSHRFLTKFPVPHNFPISIYEHFFISGDVMQNLKQSEGKHPFEHLSAIHDIQQHVPHLNCSPQWHWIQWWNTSLELKGTIQNKKGLGERLWGITPGRTGKLGWILQEEQQPC